MDLLRWHPDMVSVLGTIAAIAAYIAIAQVGRKVIEGRLEDPRERYRKRQLLNIIALIIVVIVIVVLWARLLANESTFLGLATAGLAVAFKEPLLAIAGRIAISGGRIYSVGDRIEIDKVKGDIIDVGYVYTRMMELGNWIDADQVTGRLVQFSNSKLFGDTVVYNYTRNFGYLWDEIMLPITYDSDMRAAVEILLKTGQQYSMQFLEEAAAELDEMKRSLLVPDVELKPQVYLQINNNWIELTMRYVVDTKQRRRAKSFIFTEVFQQIQRHGNIRIGSETFEVTLSDTANAQPAESGISHSNQT